MGMRVRGVVGKGAAALAVVAALAALALAAACGGGDTSATLDPVYEPGAFTKALVQQAIDRYNSDGRDATVAYYNTTDHVVGEFYVYIVDGNGISIAHPTLPELVGRNLRDAAFTDSTGFHYGAAIADAPEEGAWISYYFTNPANDNATELKHGWVIRHDGLVFGSAWYP